MERNFTDSPRPAGEPSRAMPGVKPGGTLNPSLKSAPAMPDSAGEKRERQHRITRILMIAAFILALAGMCFAVAGIITGS